MFMTSAKLEDNTVVFNSNKFVKTIEDREKIDVPWWCVVAGAFIIEDKVVLVKRSSNVNFCPNCWTLLPTGVSDDNSELLNPDLGLMREAREELFLIKDNKLLNPLAYSEMVSREKVYTLDKAYDYKKWSFGNLYLSDPFLIFIQVYKLNLKLDGLKIKDGEWDNKFLNREIKLISLDDLDSIEPVAPSLEWLRENVDKVKEMIENGIWKQ